MADGTLYPTYGSPRTLAQIKLRTDWIHLDPEFARRVEAIMVACDGKLGFGGGWRSSVQQEQLFRSRYHVDPKGTISWNGQHWTKNPGVASAAPPGSSYHESTTKVGGAFAVDFTGQVSLLASRGHEFGLVEFGDVNNEPWHAQPIEIPHARRDYNANYEPLTRWPIPNQPPEEDDEMNTARLVKNPKYANIWLVGAGPALALSPQLYDSYVAQGVPIVVSDHPQLLQALLVQSGLQLSDLVPV